MEAKELRSRYQATARLGRRRETTAKRLAAILIGAAFSSCCSVSNQAETYTRIQKQSRQSSFAAASEAARRAYLESQSQPGTQWHWRFQLLYAEMLLFDGKTTQAKPLLQTEPPFKELRPRREMLRGYVAYREGRGTEAESTVQSAAEEAARQGDYESQADALLINAAYSSANNASARELVIQQILEIGRTHNLPYQLAAGYLDFGFLRMRQSRFGEAIPYFDQAVSAAQQAGASLLRSIATGNLATCYYNLGDFARAIELRKSAISSQKAAGLIPALRDSYLELGVSQSLQGDNKHAVESLRSALALVNPQDSPGPYSRIATNLASVLESIGSIDEAEALNESVSRVIKPEDTEAKASLLANQGAIFHDRGSDARAIAAYKQSIEISAKLPSQLWVSSAALAYVYANQKNLASARKYFELALTTIAASRADQLKSDYQITFLSELIGFYQNYVEFLMTHDDVASALRIADSSRAGVLAEKLGTSQSSSAAGNTLPILEASRGSGQTFLFYWFAPHRSYVWVVENGKIHAATLRDGQELASAAQNYRYLIEKEKIDPLAAGHNLPIRLFEMLVDPALPFIPKGSEIVIVPDDALHGLNFETLVVSSPAPHYWLNDVTISIAPSLTLLSTDAPISRKRSVLVIGDPDYTGTGVTPLATAGNEIDRLVQNFGAQQSVVKRGRNAVPRAYRDAEPGKFSNIHFAAHAEVNDQSPLESAILLSRQNDGFRLYAHEITEVPLTADLVTLSACRSAGDRAFTGEGLVGFSWAFFQAGARNVVAGLWDVNDRSTADLMDAFYTNIDAGMSYAQALRKAKLALVATNFGKPYYWAPFQLYSRSVQPRRNQLRGKSAH